MPLCRWWQPPSSLPVVLLCFNLHHCDSTHPHFSGTPPLLAMQSFELNDSDHFCTSNVIITVATAADCIKKSIGAQPSLV